jgi:hypothetical protein
VPLALNATVRDSPAPEPRTVGVRVATSHTITLPLVSALAINAESR